MSSLIADPSLTGAALETPGLEDVIRLAMRSVALDLRVAMPCAISKVRGNQLVDVQPLLQAKYLAKATATTLKPIPNVLVSMPQGAGYSIKLPLAVGDTGFCLFCDRSLDAWAASSGGVVDPGDGRLHDMMDAIFVPGLVPMGGQTTDTTSDLVLTNGAAEVRLEKSGRLSLGNGTQELLSLVEQLVALNTQLLANLEAAPVNPLGPMTFNAGTLSELSTLAATNAIIKANLDILKG